MSKVQTQKQEIEHLEILRQALTELGIDFEEKNLKNDVEYSQEVKLKYSEISKKRKIKEAEKREIEHLKILRQALTELGIDFEEKNLKDDVEYSQEVNLKYLEILERGKKIFDTQKIRSEKKISQTEVLILSNVPEKRIKFVINSNSYVEVHEDNMDFYNVILKKYRQIYKKNFMRISRTVHNSSIINRAKRLGYNIEQTKFSNNNVRFVLKNNRVRQKKAEMA